jgi:putative membrane protein
MRFLFRLLINAAALWVAVRLVPGIRFHGSAFQLLGIALVFGVLNAVIRPILMVVSIPLVVLTLGLFTLVLNGVILLLTSGVSGALGLAFHVSGFAAAFWGAIVVSIVSMVLTILVRDNEPKSENA